jgi:uncharacterized membrane protein YcaP (DUF421 family)
MNPIDWSALWQFSVNPLELVLRGTAVYWALFALFRFVLRRDAGTLGIPDLLLVVLVADAVQNAMAGGYRSIGEGLLLVATLAGWNWLLDWASFRWRWARRLSEPAPLVMVRRGRMLRANMRREMLTPQELMSSLREQGIDKLHMVKIARMEADGQISVIREPEHASGDDQRPPERGRAPIG